MGGRAWWVIVHGVEKSQTRLSEQAHIQSTYDSAWNIVDNIYL